MGHVNINISQCCPKYCDLEVTSVCADYNLCGGPRAYGGAYLREFKVRLSALIFNIGS